MRIDLEKIEGILAAWEEPPIVLTPRLCTQYRSPLSRCNDCVKYCPRECLDLRGEISLMEGCTGCGICIAACPVGVFELRQGSERELLTEMPSLLKEGRVIVIACRENKEGKKASLIVPCIYGLTEAFLLGTLALGAESLYLAKGPCSGCLYSRGQPVFERTWANSLNLLALFSIPDNRLHLVKEGEIPEPFPGGQGRPRETIVVSRRDFMASVKRQSIKALLSFFSDLGEGVKETEFPGKPRLPMRRHLLLKYCRDLPIKMDLMVPAEGAPLISLTGDPEKCDASGACVRLCPTGALKEGRKEGRFFLRFRPAWCTNCGLCLDVCYPKALIAADPFPLALIMKTEEKTLIEAEEFLKKNLGNQF